MMEWFMSGGFGMFTVLAIGVGSIGYGAKAVRHVTPERLAVLRALPALILVSAVVGFGTGLWAVNRFLEKGMAGGRGDLAVLGLVGLTEAAQVLTLGSVLAMIVLMLRVVAEAKGGGKPA